MQAEAEEVEKINQKAEEEESKSGKKELDGEKERVAVVCKRGSLRVSFQCVWEGCEKGFEEEVVEVSGDEWNWFEVSVCVTAAVPSVLTQTSPVDMVWDLDFGVSDITFDEAWHQGLIGIRAPQESESKHGKTTSQSCANAAAKKANVAWSTSGSAV